MYNEKNSANWCISFYTDDLINATLTRLIFRASIEFNLYKGVLIVPIDYPCSQNNEALFLMALRKV